MTRTEFTGQDPGTAFYGNRSGKASAPEWSHRELSLQDISDLLWAADGLNRPEEKKATAISALNAHDIDIQINKGER